MSQCWQAQVTLVEEVRTTLAGSLMKNSKAATPSALEFLVAGKGRDQALPAPNSWQSQAQPCSLDPGVALPWAGLLLLQSELPHSLSHIPGPSPGISSRTEI